MGIRETINKNPIIPISLSALAIIAAIFFVTREFACDKRPVTGTPQAAYYTTDDGQTWFVDDIYKITPFDKDGKQAVKLVFRNCMVRCALFRYGHEQKQSLCMMNHGLFCGYVQKITGKRADLEILHAGENACLKELLLQP